MHDHSRFQRDIDDVTGVSLSLSLLLTKVTHAQYRKRFRASYNILAKRFARIFLRLHQLQIDGKTVTIATESVDFMDLTDTNRENNWYSAFSFFFQNFV